MTDIKWNNIAMARKRATINLLDKKFHEMERIQMKKTKEQISNELAEVKSTLTALERKDFQIREQFSKVLTCPSNRPVYHLRAETLSWEQIFFSIGELNSDANYTILLGIRADLEQKVRELEEIIKEKK